jgi:hypothetical protein
VQKVLIDGRELGSEGDSKVLQHFSLRHMLAIVSGSRLAGRKVSNWVCGVAGHSLSG